MRFMVLSAEVMLPARQSRHITTVVILLKRGRFHPPRMQGCLAKMKIAQVVKIAQRAAGAMIPGLRQTTAKAVMNRSIVENRQKYLETQKMKNFFLKQPNQFWYLHDPITHSTTTAVKATPNSIPAQQSISPLKQRRLRARRVNQPQVRNMRPQQVQEPRANLQARQRRQEDLKAVEARILRIRAVRRGAMRRRRKMLMRAQGVLDSMIEDKCEGTVEDYPERTVTPSANFNLLSPLKLGPISSTLISSSPATWTTATPSKLCNLHPKYPTAISTTAAPATAQARYLVAMARLQEKSEQQQRAWLLAEAEGRVRRREVRLGEERADEKLAVSYTDWSWRDWAQLRVSFNWLVEGSQCTDQAIMLWEKSLKEDSQSAVQYMASPRGNRSMLTTTQFLPQVLTIDLTVASIEVSWHTDGITVLLQLKYSSIWHQEEHPSLS